MGVVKIDSAVRKTFRFPAVVLISTTLYDGTTNLQVRKTIWLCLDKNIRHFVDRKWRSSTVTLGWEWADPLGRVVGIKMG